MNRIQYKSPSSEFSVWGDYGSRIIETNRKRELLSLKFEQSFFFEIFGTIFFGVFGLFINRGGRQGGRSAQG